MKSNLIVFTLSFFVGVLLGEVFDWGIIFALFFIFLTLPLSSLLLLSKKQKEIFFVLTVLFGLAIGLFRVDFDIREKTSVLSESINKEINIEGVIVDNPEEREKSLRFILKTETNKEKILIYSEKFFDFQYGDRLIVSGRLEEPENFEGLGGRIFDYKNYLAKDGIYYQTFYPKLEKIGEGEGNLIKRKLFTLKNRLTLNIKRIIPNPESTLLSGLLFGEKGSFEKSLEENFRKTGLVHIVVLSGYNISIIADSVMKTLSFASFPIAAFLGAGAIILFAIMTGLGAATVRASIMALLVILSRLTGRRYDIFRALMFAGFLMVFLNPKILLFDPGFQLSFMATLGLLLVSPIISERLSFLKRGIFLKELISATISTQIFVLPILLYQIGEISLIAPLSNLIILPLVPLSMLLGFLTSISSFLGNLISFIPGYSSFLLLHFEIGTVNFMGSLPFASIIFPKLPFIIVPIFYLLVFYLLRLTEKRHL